MGENTSATGGCFCGAIEFKVTLPTKFCAHCHCTMCQRAHGAGFVTWFAVPVDRFELTDPEKLLTRYRSSDHGTRSFCGRCGSTLFCESTREPEDIDIVLANMHEPIDREPNCHAYFDDRASWTRANDSLTKLGGVTGLEKLEPAED